MSGAGYQLLVEGILETAPDLAGLAVFVVAVRLVTTRAVSPPPTTSGRSPAGSASR
jgi:hypothetical protein